MANPHFTPDVEEHSPYDEPDPENDVWPDDWTPKQRENWREFGQELYEELETDVGRYWYRRTWRPKKQGDGMMTRDHVKFGTPEDYVEDKVDDTLSPMRDLTAGMMRTMTSYRVGKDELDEAVEDICQAKIELMTPEQKASLARGRQRLARAYGLDS